MIVYRSLTEMLLPGCFGDANITIDLRFKNPFPFLSRGRRFNIDARYFIDNRGGPI